MPTLNTPFLSRLPVRGAQRGAQRGVQRSAMAFACLLLCATSTWAADEISGSIRAQWTDVGINSTGPLALANAQQAGFVDQASNSLLLSTELKGRWKALSSTVTFQQQRQQHEAGSRTSTTHSSATVNELFASLDADAWQFSGGKKIVAWDVGFGFRPNDVVQQEERRPLFGTTAQGRPVMMAEYFSADTSWSLVWANPTAETEKRGGQEPALAGRYYQRQGDFDWHGFARLGAHTGGSVGAAMVWVASESLAVHASVRTLQRYDSYAASVVPSAPSSASSSTSASTLLAASPWQPQRQGHANQALIGTTWTSEDQTSIHLEAWWDGTALSNTQWDAWNQRNQALTRLNGRGIPVKAIAGNLAWQADAFGASSSLRRANVFVRWSKSLGAWTPALDLLTTPADGGRIVSASVVWQGDRISISAGARVYAGPADAVLAQLPSRQTAYLNGTWAF